MEDILCLMGPSILLGVFIHRRFKHSTRILGSEEGLNNY